eukprot:1140558-Pelagomonas_calceolata.AAC.1
MPRSRNTAGAEQATRKQGIQTVLLTRAVVQQHSFLRHVLGLGVASTGSGCALPSFLDAYQQT